MKGGEDVEGTGGIGGQRGLLSTRVKGAGYPGARLWSVTKPAPSRPTGIPRPPPPRGGLEGPMRRRCGSGFLSICVGGSPGDVSNGGAFCMSCGGSACQGPGRGGEEPQPHGLGWAFLSCDMRTLGCHWYLGTDEGEDPCSSFSVESYRKWQKKTLHRRWANPWNCIGGGRAGDRGTRPKEQR